MPIVLSLLWACFTAVCVFHMLSRDSARRIEDATDETVGAAVSGVDPGFAATVTFLFGIAAPYFLYRSRGWKGLAQGIGLLLVSGVGYVGSGAALVLLAR